MNTEVRNEGQKSKGEVIMFQWNTNQCVRQMKVQKAKQKTTAGGSHTTGEHICKLTEGWDVRRVLTS